MRALLAVFILLASGLAHAQFGSGSSDNPFGATTGGTEFLPVEEAYQLEVEVQDDGKLRVYWQIADAYYLYQHRFKFTLPTAPDT